MAFVQRRAARALLRADALEDRLVPALAIQFDYSHDTSGFFNDPARRADLQLAADTLAAQITTSLPAITPNAAAGNSWAAEFNDPATKTNAFVQNLVVPQDTMIVYVGGSQLAGGEAGDGGPGGYQAGGGTAWVNLIANRGPDGYRAWGGSISFTSNENWYFGTNAAGLGAGQIDFYSVATHELGHVLGFGTSPQFAADIQNGSFAGSHVVAAAGAAPAVSTDQAHFAEGTTSAGNPVSMQPVLVTTQRVGFSQLDYAALADVGWQVSGASPPVTVSPPATVPPVVPPTVPPVTPGGVIPGLAPGAAIIPTGSGTTNSIKTGTTTTTNSTTSSPAAVSTTTGLPAGTLASQVTITSGAADGSIQVFLTGAGGQLTAVGGPLYPFPGFVGAVRAVAADVTGDGTADIVAGMGPGSGSQVTVLDGRTFATAAVAVAAFEPSYKGGVFLAAGDLGGNGRADVVVTPDQGGGARVRILGLSGNQLTPVVGDFLGIADPNFRGGARATVADVNGDGAPDLVVVAGTGGGPRVSIIDGQTVLTGTRRNLVADFFAFEPSLANGVYVAAGTVNGSTDLVFGAGPGGGPRLLVVKAQTLVTAGPAAALANPVLDTFVGDPAGRGGVRVAVKDNGVVTGSGSGPVVSVYQPAAGGGLSLAAATDPLAAVTNDGVYVG